jgi:CheY-like chemotaxis protein
VVEVGDNPVTDLDEVDRCIDSGLPAVRLRWIGRRATPIIYESVSGVQRKAWMRPNERTVTKKTKSRLRMSFLPNRNLVLVVDDDRGMLRAMKRLLRQHGYDTLLFPSADAFKNHNDFENVVCIILDINLNDGSGLALRHRLKAARISVPVIYITANDNTAVRVAALQSGCLAYLTKPFSPKSLIEPLKRASAEPI